MSVDIGNRIREIRRSQKITLKAMSEATSLSESYLSQVERGTCAASVSSLEKIAEVLNTNVDVLVLEGQEFHTARCDQIYRAPVGEAFFYKKLSDSSDGKKIVCREYTMLPQNPEQLFPLEDSGFIYILSGYLTIKVGHADEEKLFPGDSIYHDPDMDMICWNNSPFLVTFLYVTYKKDEGISV